MTGDNKFRFFPGILSFMFPLMLLSGCIAENTDDCFKGILLKVNLPAGISQETIKDISLYVFDDKDLLLDEIPMDNSEPVILNYPGIPNLHCVAWCNLQEGTMFVNPLKKGDPLSKGFISLKPSVSTRETVKNLYASPGDLFFGELKIENNAASYQAEEQSIKVNRTTASMNITLRGLQKLTGTTNNEYTLIIRETSSRIDFNEHYGGEPASYSPTMNLAANKDYVVPAFQLFPTPDGNGLTIDIYQHTSLLKSIKTDGEGKSIVPVVGKTLNLLLDFGGTASVEIALTGWGETYVWKEYN